MYSSYKRIVLEFIAFGLQEVRACVFAGSFFTLLFLSTHIHLFGLARYDFLFLGAIGIQIILYLLKLETIDEIKVIFLFHIIGLILELYKTSPGIVSWSYPESAFFKLYTVPLYSGFMYAAVGSYISQAWKQMNLRLEYAPSYTLSLFLCALIYLNFFTNHFLPDFRWILIPLVFVFFYRTRIYFTVLHEVRWMYLNLSFILIAFFIWIAENISTYYGAWKYPDQIHAWSVVSTGKITSWFLLVIISFIIVAYLKHYKKTRCKNSI
jgi:uncharacterized membrane protein YoaT (DUF817 family)